MAVNKVNAKGKTLIDLTADTVTPEKLLKGVKAHDASGEQITGAMVVPDGIPKATKIKYIIPATFTPPRASNDNGYASMQFGFTRENVNQLYFVDWQLHDTPNFSTTGYWMQHIIWSMLYQGNYQGQHLNRVDWLASGSKGNLLNGDPFNMAKTALSLTRTIKEYTTTDATYKRLGNVFKGLIFIYDSTYDGSPMVDETKLSQFFTCDYITAGW